MRKSLWIVLALILVGGAQVAHADGLLGSSVTGSLVFGIETVNAFDPSLGIVPPGFGNSSGTTVTIVNPGIEFGINDGAGGPPLVTADFTNTTLTISELCTDTFCGEALFGFTMTFTDTAFTGLTLAKISDSFVNGGLTGSLAGDTLTITWRGTCILSECPAGSGTVGGPFDFPQGATDSGEFSVTSAPEPSSLTLIPIGLGALLLIRRRAGHIRPSAI